MYENPLNGRKFIYSSHKTESFFLFGDNDRNSFNTTVQTHFKDMTNEKIKGISSYVRNNRYSHVRPLRVTETENDDSDSDNDSDNDSEGDNVDVEIN